MTPPPRYRVLVTDAHTTSALAIVRSLGAAGMSVTAAGESGRFNLAGYSRHAKRLVTLEPADERPLRTRRASSTSSRADSTTS